MENMTFKGYLTHRVTDAIKHYSKTVGKLPTLILCRPDYEVEGQSEILVRSKIAGANMLMVTHLIEAAAYVDNFDMNKLFGRSAADKEETASIGKMALTGKHNGGRPGGVSAVCPHCANRIRNFEALGFWYGWAMGIEPPYWDALRQYIFDRDDYKCASCHQKFPVSGLQAHHIQSKEEGGTDSARNLTTLCTDCHKDHQPIFDEEA